MRDEDDDGGMAEMPAADLVYRGPASAEAKARSAIGDPATTDAARAEALATLGRTAYYDNRISEAIRLLTSATSFDIDEGLRSEVSLILAPALSKQGQSAEALELLDDLERGPTAEVRAKALNQRGAILVELGQLAEALESFDRAADLHRQLGDVGGEGRALLNMGAAASELGDQAGAERFYERAWQLNRQSGQQVMCAMIEGNLGYVFSRKGDFGSALEWYRRGRESFGQLGDVDLLVAVLETDHATTLLDLGLNREAYEAAEFARASSVAGDNQLLEVQAQLLLGQARLRLRQFAAAEATLRTVSSAATALGFESVRLRSDYLRQRLRYAQGGVKPEPAATIELADGLRDAGWNREALRALVLEANALLDTDDAMATEMLTAAEKLGDDGVDAIDRAYASALVACIADDNAAFEQAIGRGEAEMGRQRQLVSSAELQTRLGHRIRDLRELAIRKPIGSGDTLEILDTYDRLHLSRFNHRRPGRTGHDLRGQLRDVRVGLQEAKLKGQPAAGLHERATELEQRILELSENEPEGSEIVPLQRLLSQPTTPAVISFFAHRSRLMGVSPDCRIGVHDLGSIESVRQAIRAQRAGLRRMAAGDDRGRGRVEAASERLGSLLFDPLDIPGDGPLALVPDGALAGISWAGIPTLQTRSFFVALSVRRAVTPTPPIRVASVGLLSGGGLDFAAAEVETIAKIWSSEDPSVLQDATKAEACSTFAAADLVHMAAHGIFRADNPFLSAVRLRDGDMTLIDLESQERMPNLVALASCDSGSAIEVGTEQIGTTDALLSLGVEAILASSLIVDDAAAGRLAIDLHRALAAGRPLVQALDGARKLAMARDTTADLAAAFTFAVHGSSATLQPLDRTGISH